MISKALVALLVVCFAGFILAESDQKFSSVADFGVSTQLSATENSIERSEKIAAHHGRHHGHQHHESGCNCCKCRNCDCCTKNQQVAPKRVEPSKGDHPEACEICIKVVQLVKDSGKVEQIKGMLEKMCKFCNVPDKCKKTIEELSQLIESNPPEMVCKIVGICTSKKSDRAGLLGLLGALF